MGSLRSRSKWWYTVLLGGLYLLQLVAAQVGGAVTIVALLVSLAVLGAVLITLRLKPADTLLLGAGMGLLVLTLYGHMWRVTDTATSVLAGLPESDLPVAGRLVAIAQVHGPAKALEALATSRVSDVHGVAVAIGHASVQSGVPVETAYANCTKVGEEGCYHGVLRAYIVTNTRLLALDLEPLCAGINSDACWTGIGYGLQTRFHQDVERALTWCDMLSKTRRELCDRGVFIGIKQAQQAHLLAPNFSLQCSRLSSKRYLEVCTSVFGSVRVVP